MAEAKSYAYVIERAVDGSYGAYLLDLPGCTASADALDEIEAKLREAVELYLSYYRYRGEPTPTPQAKVGLVTAA